LNLALRNRIADWMLEALERPTSEGPLRALIEFARRADPEGFATMTAPAAGMLVAAGDLFEPCDGGVRLRPDLCRDLEALRRRAERFEQAIARSRERCGEATKDAPGSTQPESIAWCLCAAAALFDEGLFFEVHELLEPAWGRAGVDLRVFLQGMIQIAVGLHHHGNGNLRGAVSLLVEGRAKLERFRPRDYGVALERFCAGIDHCAAEAMAELEGRPHAALEIPSLGAALERS
jgi:hypothetical protein